MNNHVDGHAACTPTVITQIDRHYIVVHIATAPIALSVYRLRV